MEEQKKLIPWDGTCEKTNIRYKSFSPMWKDENGTIWHKDSEGKLYIWCSAERLFNHLCKLHRLGFAE